MEFHLGHCLPGAFVNSVRKRGSENDLKRGLCASTGGIERDLFGCAERGSAEMFQAIVGIPVAGAAVFNEPLFI